MIVGKRIVVELTTAERDAVLLAVNNFLEGDRRDRLSLWLNSASVRAAERAVRKLTSTGKENLKEVKRWTGKPKS